MSMHIFHRQPQQLRTGGLWQIALGALAATALSSSSWAASFPSQVVPGYVAPVAETNVDAYADDTRGVYVPPHTQLREKTEAELAAWSTEADQTRPLYAQKNPTGRQYEQALNTVANGVADTRSELDRISRDPGLLSGGTQSADAKIYAGDQYADNTPSQPFGSSSQAIQLAQNNTRDYSQISPAAGPGTRTPDLSTYPSLATGGQARTDIAPAMAGPSDGGVELAVGASGPSPKQVDLQNGIVRLKEERISVRRALQRMLDQVGGGSWTVVWDLDEVNAGLPDMEISVYAEEPFIKVMNALLARLQTRSGQPIRVIKYDKTQRLVITDRTGGDARTASIGAGSSTKGENVAVTETVLKESSVSLHYDEIPLVDALENIVNQAGKGQWRLRMYAGTDQVLKPAHVEEPFGVALERILKIFNLRYELFPGGKLIVVTSGSSFGFRGVQ